MSSAKIRATTSVVPPALKPTINLIGRSGQSSCAAAGAAKPKVMAPAAAALSATTHNRRRKKLIIEASKLFLISKLNVNSALPYFEQSSCQFEIYNKRPWRTSILTLVKQREFAIK